MKNDNSSKNFYNSEDINEEVVIDGSNLLPLARFVPKIVAKCGINLYCFKNNQNQHPKIKSKKCLENNNLENILNEIKNQSNDQKNLDSKFEINLFKSNKSNEKDPLKEESSIINKFPDSSNLIDRNQKNEINNEKEGLVMQKRIKKFLNFDDSSFNEIISKDPHEDFQELLNKSQNVNISFKTPQKGIYVN